MASGGLDYPVASLHLPSPTFLCKPNACSLRSQLLRATLEASSPAARRCFRSGEQGRRREATREGAGRGEEKCLTVGKVNEEEERETLNLEAPRVPNAK
jgi:hypothetical protein